MLDNEFEDDIVFARFLNYMQIALLHRKLNYERDNEIIIKKEEQLSYFEWSRIPDKTDKNNPFYTLKKDYDSLKNAIDKLTEKQRFVIVNYYFKRKSLSKIAEKLNTNVDSVNHLKYRAILSLRRYLEE